MVWTKMTMTQILSHQTMKMIMMGEGSINQNIKWDQNLLRRETTLKISLEVMDFSGKL